MANKRRRGDSPPPLFSTPTAIVEHIARYIGDCDDFFAFLSCFQDQQGGETLGDLGHFLALAATLDPTDLWPKFRLRRLTSSLVPSIRCITRFFTTIYVFEVFDIALLQQCLHPHNVVELLVCPPQDQVDKWLTTPVSKLPLQHITFNSQDVRTTDVFLEQLESMPDLVSLHIENTTFRDLDSLFEFIQASSKLVRLNLSVLFLMSPSDHLHSEERFVSAKFQRRHLDILIAWLKRSPVTAIILKKWDFEEEDETSAELLLEAVFGSSTIQHLVLIDPTLSITASRADFPM
ncbi:unnamed protein product [Aphanomyces euteiches]